MLRYKSSNSFISAQKGMVKVEAGSFCPEEEVVLLSFGKEQVSPCQEVGVVDLHGWVGYLFPVQTYPAA